MTSKEEEEEEKEEEEAEERLIKDEGSHGAPAATAIPRHGQ